MCSPIYPFPRFIRIKSINFLFIISKPNSILYILQNQPFSIASRQFLSPCNCMTSYSTLALKRFPIDIERHNIERHYIERHFSESQNLNYSFHCAIIWLSRPISVKQQTVQSCIKLSSGKDGKDIFVE